MKWKSTPAISQPFIGQIRVRTRFAFLPRQCEDGYTRWLERVVATEEYRTVRKVVVGGSDGPSFDARDWRPIKYDAL